MTSSPTPLLGYRRNGQPIYQIAGGAPTALESALTAVGTAGPSNGQTPLQIIRSKRDLLHRAVGASLDGIAAEQRGLHASEQRQHDKAKSALAQLDERLGELEEQQSRNAVADAARAVSGEPAPGLQRGYTSSETYFRGPNSSLTCSAPGLVPRTPLTGSGAAPPRAAWRPAP